MNKFWYYWKIKTLLTSLRNKLRWMSKIISKPIVTEIISVWCRKLPRRPLYLAERKNQWSQFYFIAWQFCIKINKVYKKWIHVFRIKNWNRNRFGRLDILFSPICINGCRSKPEARFVCHSKFVQRISRESLRLAEIYPMETTYRTQQCFIVKMSLGFRRLCRIKSCARQKCLTKKRNEWMEENRIEFGAMFDFSALSTRHFYLSRRPFIKGSISI